MSPLKYVWYNGGGVFLGVCSLFSILIRDSPFPTGWIRDGEMRV